MIYSIALFLSFKTLRMICSITPLSLFCLDILWHETETAANRHFFSTIIYWFKAPPPDANLIMLSGASIVLGAYATMLLSSLLNVRDINNNTTAIEVVPRIEAWLYLWFPLAVGSLSYLLIRLLWFLLYKT